MPVPHRLPGPMLKLPAALKSLIALKSPAALLAATAVLSATALLPAPAQAQRGVDEAGWGAPGWQGPNAQSWGDPRWGDSRWSGPLGADSRENQVQMSRFLAEGAGPALGHGKVAVVTSPGSIADDREQATFEAAVVDQLAHAGYDTAAPVTAAPVTTAPVTAAPVTAAPAPTPAPDQTGGQITEVAVSHTIVEPPEPPHKPVSGEMSMGVSNRGSGMALALNIDMTRPKAALISTRLQARIRDRATGTALWEGRAEIVTREGDPKWGDTAIASRLAAALFAHFPGHPGETTQGY